MKSEDSSSNSRRLVISSIIVFIALIGCYIKEYNYIYKTIVVKTTNTSIVEYGSGNYDLNELIDKIDGEITAVKKDIDTSKVGEQKIVLEVKKDDVVKEVPIIVEVKDTTAPEIKIKSEEIVITAGDEYDILSNLDSVLDVYTGEISYQQKEIVEENIDTNYYTVDGNVNTSVPGTYPIVIKAVDMFGNRSELTYNVVVNQKVQKVDVIQTKVDYSINNNYVGVGDKAALINMAYSLVGSRYVSGGTNPSVGFDCSGFVYYLYSQIGISVSRSSSTQIYDGVGVSYDAAQPGDILSWGYSEGRPTHSAIYLGDGMMVHATNPRQGVIVSNVASWTSGSGTRVIAVRRI